MIGSGIFALPSSFGRTTRARGTLIASSSFTRLVQPRVRHHFGLASCELQLTNPVWEKQTSIQREVSMSDLVVIVYPSEAKAEEVRQRLFKLQKESRSATR
jgi:hypothetical protein